MALRQTLTKLSLAGLLLIGIDSCNKEQNIQNQRPAQFSLYKMHDKIVTPEIKLKTRLEKRIQELITESQKSRSLLIVIDKSERTLSLYDSGKIDTIYPVGFGSEILKDKEKENDQRTPEGEFTVGLTNPEGWSRYYKSLMLNYPLLEDAERGLKEKIIDKPTYKKIMQAHEKGKMPDQYTKLGGNICIHGNGSQSNWTFGCIALNNEDIDYFFRKAKIGTKVIIKK